METVPVGPFPPVEHVQGIAIKMPHFPYLRSANVYVVGRGPVTLIDAGPLRSPVHSSSFGRG